MLYEQTKGLMGLCGVGISGGRKGCSAAPPLPSCGRRWAGVVLLVGGVAEDADAATVVAAAARKFRSCCSMPLDTPPAQARLGGCELQCREQQFEQ